MKLYHGTANYNLNSFLRKGIKLYPHHHFKKPSLCTSLSLKEAGYFALRRTPANDITKTGIVLEFEADGMIEGKNMDFIYYNDHVLRNELEVVIFNTKKLILVAYYCWTVRGWERNLINVRILTASGRLN